MDYSKGIIDDLMKDNYYRELLEKYDLKDVYNLKIMEIMLPMYEKNIDLDKDPEIKGNGIVYFYFTIPEFYIDKNGEKKNYKEVIVPEAKEILINMASITIEDDEKEDFKKELLESSKFFCKVCKDVVFTLEKQEERKAYVQKQLEKIKKKREEQYEEV